MAKGPVDIREENMVLNQEDMASNQETTGPNRRPRDRKAAETETARLKGQEARRRNYEERMEKQRLAALVAEEQRLKQRKRDEGFMREASRQAKKMTAIGDIPIRCVIAYGDRVIAREYNRRNVDKNVLSHAEIISIKKACKKVGDWRLENCIVCVTLEPCPMCTGAIMQAHIPRAAMGRMNPRADCAGFILDMLHMPGFNHQAEVAEGVLEQECSKLMSGFFQNLHERKK